MAKDLDNPAPPTGPPGPGRGPAVSRPRGAALSARCPKRQGTALRRWEAYIASGEYKPGERIPSLVALIEGFGIANATGQKVIRALRADGLIHTEPGMGSFVTTAEERDKPEWPGPEARELTATVDGGENVDQPGQTA